MPRLIVVLRMLAVAASVAAVPAMAQETTRVSTLTVSAEGVAYAEPDIALVSFGVNSRDRTPAGALEANSAAMRGVIDATIAAGIAETDIATTAFFINPIYAQPDPNAVDAPPVVIAYEVRNEVTARVRGIADSGPLLDRVVTAGANSVTGLSFDLSDPKAVEDEAMVAAIAESRRKAEVMAAAAGLRLVRLLSVSTVSGGGQPQFMAFRASVPVMGGQRTVAVSVTAEYEVAPN